MTLRTFFAGILLLIIPLNCLYAQMVFAPSEGLTSAVEKPFRDEICLNGLWDFKELDAPGWEPVRIKIPSPWNVNGFSYENLEGPDHRNYPSYPQHWESILEAVMHKTVTVPENWAGARIFLHFEAVAGKVEVYVGKDKVAENFDNFLPFEADVSDFVTPGKDAEIYVTVHSQKLFEATEGVGRRIIPAGSMWGTFISGIWQDVYLQRRPAVRVEDVYIRPLVGQDLLQTTITLKNESSKTARVRLEIAVNEWLNRAGTTVEEAPVSAWELGEEAIHGPAINVTLAPGEESSTTLEIPSGSLLAWTPEHPDLYALQVSLFQGKKQIDNKYERFGYREWTLEGDKLCLNGEPYQLRGDSWHFMGIPQMTRRYAWAWYTAIKAMNGNAVRPHAQVYPRFYLDMADEMGICVLAETANWASDGGPALESHDFWEHSKDHLGRMLIRDRNHASVFGWSVSNENEPVILYVHKRPDLIPLQEKAWRDWVETVRETDPSRPWISSDGEEDGNGILPVTMGHYGDAGSMREWKAIGKPWGVGEHSMAYYGTPEEVSKYNGDRAYESALGRMEGLANESYNLISAMREAGASYSTVFNMVWYALKPLPLGKKDLTSAPVPEDGVFFGPYVEGQPGVQPERLGPYSTTLNPGYDPSLPLYETWPMFDAIRAANAPGGPAWCRWSEMPGQAGHDAAGQAVTPDLIGGLSYDSVILLAAPDSRLGRILEAQGVVLSAKPKGRTLIIVDASEKNVLPKGAENCDVWYWGLCPETLDYYGLDIKLDKLSRSSFLPEQRSWTRGMTNADFYFCEVQSQDAAHYTMKGSFVEEGEILLNACKADWRRWNKRAEALKTAALLRSENECTAALPVMVKNGRIWVSTLDDFLSSEKGYNTLKKLLHNAGISCKDVVNRDFSAFDDGIYQPGILTRPVK